MKTGKLAPKQFKDWKKDDLVELAKLLGVSTDGTKEEIIARICEVEVGVPDGKELTPEEVRDIRRAEAEEETKRKAAAASATTEGKVGVKAIKRFHDLNAKVIREVGEEWDVEKERAEMLKGKKLVELQ